MRKELDAVRGSIFGAIAMMLEGKDEEAETALRRTVQNALDAMKRTDIAERALLLDVAEDACQLMLWTSERTKSGFDGWRDFSCAELERLNGQETCSFLRSARALMMWSAYVAAAKEGEEESGLQRTYALMKTLREEHAYRIGDLLWYQTLMDVYWRLKEGDAREQVILREVIDGAGRMLRMPQTAIRKKMASRVRISAMNEMSAVCLRAGKRREAFLWRRRRNLEELRCGVQQVRTMLGNAADDAREAAYRLAGGINPAALLFAAAMLLAMLLLRMGQG